MSCLPPRLLFNTKSRTLYYQFIHNTIIMPSDSPTFSANFPTACPLSCRLNFHITPEFQNRELSLEWCTSLLTINTPLMTQEILKTKNIRKGVVERGCNIDDMEVSCWCHKESKPWTATVFRCFVLSILFECWWEFPGFFCFTFVFVLYSTCPIPIELFQIQMGFPFPFLCANNLCSSLLNIRARSFLLSCT